jgi:membrane protein YqaA with SNARE-associated domain
VKLSFVTQAALAAPRKRPTLIPHWITKLGPLGLFAAAAIDASVIPLPVPGTTDLLLLLLVAHNGNPWMLAPLAVAGSLLGGFTSWRLGHHGGEAALKRWVNPRLLRRISQWMERHPILAVFLPAVLPPPIPLSPFLLASGALGMPCGRFLLIFGAARSLRYILVAWVGVKYGRHVVRLWTALLSKWSTPLLWTFGIVMAASIGIAIYKLRSKGNSGGGKRRVREAAAD